jgi:hypothetical protein
MVAGRGVLEGARVKGGALRRVLDRFGELMAIDCAYGDAPRVLPSAMLPRLSSPGALDVNALSGLSEFGGSRLDAPGGSAGRRRSSSRTSVRRESVQWAADKCRNRPSPHQPADFRPALPPGASGRDPPNSDMPGKAFTSRAPGEDSLGSTAEGTTRGAAAGDHFGAVYGHEFAESIEHPGSAPPLTRAPS